MSLKKKLIITICMIFAFCCAYSMADRILNFKTEHGVVQARAFYSQPKNTVDVAFLGSSHVHCDINTAYLWERFGIAGYDYSAAEQPLWITYYYLQEFCKYQNPGLVVIDLYSPARFKDDYQYNWLGDNVYGMRFSLTKLQMLHDACEPDRYGDYFPSISAWHSEYKSVQIPDVIQQLKKDDLEAFKGYTPYMNVSVQPEPELNETRSGGFTAKSELYLMKIIEYTRAHDIDLFLMVSPYITISEDETVYNRIKEIAEQYDVSFISTNYNYQDMGLNFSTDFNDASHLNYLGSCKFTEFLGHEIKERFDIPDRRGQNGYESWDRHVEMINEQVYR
ncbi:hypothetical protein [Butyrivibrio sp. INlla16]|uniref:hypothetical protein n=1 Tax=Butyrivibrio sp. INlla16 TaxID=1520807 RepID=UPI00088E5F8C|nr:hypothetical protein [Butyrivibrio sp. INlla16]SDB45853.1 hypothetical protein SAMN02910263_02254 [Butyrivibrio sp. INlla16]